MLAMWLSGCGEDFATFRFEAARLVTSQLKLVEDGSPPPYPEYLAIELSSDTEILQLDIGNGPYARADTCSQRERAGVAAFGPLNSDGEEVRSWEGLRTQPNPRDGRYRYYVYIVPLRPVMGVRYARAQFPQPEYDLRHQDFDLCLWFSAPAYNGIFRSPALSNTVVFLPAP